MIFFITISTSVFSQKSNLLPDTLGICFGDTSDLEIKQSLDNTYSIQWSTPYNIITNTKKIKVSKSGKYFLKISSSRLVSPFSDSTYVKVFSKPKKLLRDTFLCKNKAIRLDCRQTGMKYQWNTGQVTQTILVDNPGRYWVKITNGSCTISDTLQVTLVDPVSPNTSNEYTFCLNEENKQITIKAIPGIRVLWSTGESNTSISVTREGTYWVKTQSAYCGERTDSIRVKLKVCDCEMMIPNSFTPNEDNRNDYFFPVLQCDYSYYNLTVSDRWGNTVFSTNNVNGKWDGRFKGNLCSEDIYIYHIESTEKGSDKKQVRNGRISLFR